MRSRLLFASAVAALVSTGCADFHRGPAPRDGSADGFEVVDVTFEGSVYPILDFECVECHSASGQASSTNFVLTGNARLDRAMVVALVTPGNPSESRLLVQATSDSHGGGQRFATDSSEYQTISAWILGLP